MRNYRIDGRKVGAIGIFHPIITLEARDHVHAQQRAERLYEEGWEHLSVHAPACPVRECMGQCVRTIEKEATQ